MVSGVRGCDSMSPQLVRCFISLCICSGTIGWSWRDLPAAAQRLVEGDQVRGDGRARLGQAVLLLQQRTLRVQHALVVHGALAVLHHRELDRPLRGLHGGLLEHRRLLRVDEPGQRVLDLLRRLEHGVAVVDEQLLEPRVLDAHAVREAAVVEERPVDPGADGIEEAAGGEEVVAAPVAGARLRARSCPKQREARIELGLGDADARALRGGAAARRCGCPDAAAASRPARRRPPSRAPSGSPAGPPAAPRRSPVGCPSSVLSALRACCSPVCSCGDRGPRALEQRRRPASTSSSEVAPLRKRDSAISSASSWTLAFSWACAISTSKVRISDVGPRDLGGQRDQRGVVVGHRREQAGGLRLHAAPVLAPEVQLPGGVEAELVVRSDGGEVEDRRRGGVLAEPHRRRAARTPPGSAGTAGRWRCPAGRAPRRSAGPRSAAAGSAGRRARPGCSSAGSLNAFHHWLSAARLRRQARIGRAASFRRRWPAAS